MSPWTDLLVSGLAMAAGLTVGWWSGRGRSWVMVYGLALAVTVAIGSVTRWPQTSEFWFLGWAGDVRLKCWLGAFVVPALLLAPTHRLATGPRFRILAGASFMAVLIGLGPLASAAMVSGQLLEMPTRLGRDGICRQQTDFTCGPAAAVTALRRFGVTADEGQLAMAALTTPFTGTSPEAMGRMLRRGYAHRGIKADVRHFDDIQDLDPTGVTLVVVRYGFMLDHWVCVLGVSAKGVEVGDPNIGRETWTRKDFEERWRKVGVTVERRGEVAGLR